MSDPFDGMTEDEKRSLFEARRLVYFVSSARCPMLWQKVALRHIRTAKLAYQFALDANTKYLGYMNHQEPGSSGRVPDDIARAGEESNLLCDFFLHSGYALECFLKGALLFNQPNRIKAGKRAPQELDRLTTTHDLSELFRQSKIKVTALETDLLELITRHVTWGKYIVPTHSNDMPNTLDQAEFMAQGLNCPFDPFEHRKAEEEVGKLFTKAERPLNEAIAKYQQKLRSK